MIYSLTLPSSVNFFQKMILKRKYRQFTDDHIKEVSKWTQVPLDNIDYVHMEDGERNRILDHTCVSRAEYVSFILIPLARGMKLQLNYQIKEWLKENISDEAAFVSGSSPDVLSRACLKNMLDTYQFHQDLTLPVHGEPRTASAQLFHPALMFKNPNDAMLFKLSF